MIERDQDAHNYISHPKFPTQVARLREFLAGHPPAANGGNVLDLGCGPGPTTRLLVEAGYDVVAVDFSIRSLALNARLCGTKVERTLFVQADLRAMTFADNAFDGLMMADFLQHLGDRAVQEAFLANAFRALKPGGWFYLSFFNTGLADRLKDDLSGTRGGIPYWRLRPERVRAMLPENAVVEREHFMNVFDRPVPDKIASRLPFAGLFARMAVIQGRKHR